MKEKVSESLGIYVHASRHVTCTWDQLHGTISNNLTRILGHAGNGIDMDAEKWADVEQVWNGFRRHRKKKGKQSLMFEVSRAERIALASLRLYSSERSDVRSHLSPTQPLCRL